MDMRFVNQDPEALSQHQREAQGYPKMQSVHLSSQPTAVAVMLWAGQAAQMP